MQSTIRNISGAALSIPALGTNGGMFNLNDGQAKNFVYSNIKKPQLDSLLSLAGALSIDFPGGPDDFGFTGTTQPGLEDKKVTYTISGQEPMDVPVGTVVFSILDNAQKIWNGATWSLTNGGDYWELIQKNGHQRAGQLVALSDTKAMMVPGLAGWDTAVSQYLDAFVTGTVAIPGPDHVAGNGDDVFGQDYTDAVVLPFETVPEIFDIKTKKWTNVAPMPNGHAFGAAAVLPSGKVLVLGGIDQASNGQSPYEGFGVDGKGGVQVDGVQVIHGDPHALTDKADIYDPATNTWTATDPIPCDATAAEAYKVGTTTKATVLAIDVGDRSKVDVDDASGFAVGNIVFVGFNVFNPYNMKTVSAITAIGGGAYTSGSGTVVMDTPVDTGIDQDAYNNMHVVKTQAVSRIRKGIRWNWSQPTFRLNNGKILVVGGDRAASETNNIAGDGVLFDGLADDETNNKAFLYDETAAPGSKWTATPDMPAGIKGVHGAVLTNGKVLLIGGSLGAGTLLYDPAGGGTWTAKADMPSIQDPEQDGSFSFSIDDNDLVLDDVLPGFRDTDAIVAMDGNKVLVAGGFYLGQADHFNIGFRKSCLVYDLSANSWTRIGDLPGVTIDHPFAPHPMYWDAGQQGGVIKLDGDDNNIYFLAGTNNQNMQGSSAVYHLNKDTMTWEPVTGMPLHPGGVDGGPTQNVYGINCGVITNDFEHHLNYATVALKYKGVSHILMANGPSFLDNNEYFLREFSSFIGSDVQPVEYTETIFYTPGKPGKHKGNTKLRPAKVSGLTAVQRSKIRGQGKPANGTHYVGKEIHKNKGM